jgi:hypothetical protein
LAGLDILLFTADRLLARAAVAAGITGFVVDWEDRQGGIDRSASDEGVAPDTAEDVGRMAAVPGARVVCRLNAVGAGTAREIDLAIESGARDLLVPMIDTPHQVEEVTDLVRGRAGVGIMIETTGACDRAGEIARVPVDFVYVGLLDLAIGRREGNVFRPLADGTASRLRECFERTRFGIGGVTVVDGGAPVPCPVLMGELARLRTDFVFARRSFKRDVRGRDMTVEHQRLQAAWRALRSRDAARTAADHDEFVTAYGASRPR